MIFGLTHQKKSWQYDELAKNEAASERYSLTNLRLSAGGSPLYMPTIIV